MELSNGMTDELKHCMWTQTTTLMEIVSAVTRTEPLSREIGNLISIR
jgi:hypothetical protein